MKIKKVSNTEYEISYQGEVIGTAFINHKGLYEIELPNRITVQATTQSTLKQMILKCI